MALSINNIVTKMEMAAGEAPFFALKLDDTKGNFEDLTGRIFVFSIYDNAGNPVPDDDRKGYFVATVDSAAKMAVWTLDGSLSEELRNKTPANFDIAERFDGTDRQVFFKGVISVTASAAFPAGTDNGPRARFILVIQRSNDPLTLTAPVITVTPQLYQAAASVPNPVFAAAVTVSGTAQVGQTLTASTPTVNNGAITARQWLRDGVDISGATASTYTLVSADVGKAVSHRVTATGAAGSTPVSSTSVAVTVAAAPVAAPVFSTAPSISPSSGVVGATFAASDGAASNTTSFTRRWLLSGTSIGTGTTVTPVIAGSLTLEVTATGAGGSTIATSTAVTVSPVLGTLTLSSTSATAGMAYSATINGKTSGSTITATASDSTSLTVSGTTLTGTFGAAGSPTISLVETLSGAGGSPKTSTVTLTVAAAATLPEGIVAFWDAASLSGLSDGAAVTSWTDKVGSSVATRTSDSGTNHTYVANSGGLPAVRLSGAAVLATTGTNAANTALSNSSGRGVIVVVRNVQAGQSNPCIVGWGPNDDNLLQADPTRIGSYKSMYPCSDDLRVLGFGGGTGFINIHSYNATAIKSPFPGSTNGYIGDQIAIGGWKIAGTSCCGRADVLAIIVLNRAATAADFKQVRRYYESKTGGTFPNRPFISVGGDSISDGYETSVKTNPSYTNRAVAEFAIPLGYWDHVAIVGNPWSGVGAQMASIGAVSKATGQRSTRFAFEFANMSYGTGATAYNAAQTVVSAVKTADPTCKFVMGTATADGSVPAQNETNRQDYISRLVAGMPGVDTLVRIDQDANIGVVGATSASDYLTYYASDKLHLTDAGTERLYQVFKPSIVAAISATAPLVIAIAGSSSPQKYLDEYSGGTVNNAVRVSNDGTSFSTLTLGRFGMDAGNIINAATGRGVDYLRAGAGGTTLEGWEADGSGLRAGLVAKMVAAGRCDFVLIQVGSNDVDTGKVLATDALQAARIRSLISKIRSESGFPNVKIIIGGTQDRPYGNLQPALIRQRHAELTVANNDANVYFGFSTYDLLTSDGLHQSEAGQVMSGSRFADQIVAIVNGTAQKRGPKISAVTPVSATVTDVTISHRSGTDFTPTASISGFVLTDANGADVAISGAVRRDANTVRLTHAVRGAGIAASLEYIPNAGDSDNSATLHDNSTRGLPLDPLEATIAVAAAASTISISNAPGQAATVGSAYSYVPTTTGGSGTKTWALTGTLPAGLTFSTSTGAISGTPTTVGTASGLAVTVTDTSGTASTDPFTITVSTASGGATGKLSKAKFGDTSADTSWSTVPANAGSLKNPSGGATGWSVSGGPTGAASTGTSTGNNSGVYPDDVMTSFWFGDSNPYNLTISGLDATKRYKIDLFGSRGGVSNRPTAYTINGTTLTQESANNTSRISTFTNIAPGSDGKVVVSIAPGAGSSSTYWYLGAMVITEYNAS